MICFGVGCYRPKPFPILVINGICKQQDMDVKIYFAASNRPKICRIFVTNGIYRLRDIDVKIYFAFDNRPHTYIVLPQMKFVDRVTYASRLTWGGR